MSEFQLNFEVRVTSLTLVTVRRWPSSSCNSGHGSLIRATSLPGSAPPAIHRGGMAVGDGGSAAPRLTECLITRWN